MAPLPVDKIPTHTGFHFDEVLGIFQMWNYPQHSEPLFPGISNASVVFWNAGRKTPDGYYADEGWIRKNRMCPVGCGGSIFDEHPKEEESEEEERLRPQTCAALLVAQKLGIDQLPRLQSCLRFAVEVDNNATDHPHSIAATIKKLHNNRETTPGHVRKWVKDPEQAKRIKELLQRRISIGDVFEWVQQGIYAKMCEQPQTDDFTIEKIGELMQLQGMHEPFSAEDWLRIGTDAMELDQLLFDTVTAEQYQAFKTIVPFRGIGRGSKVMDMKIAVVPSDDVRIDRYARSKLGDQVAVTVIKRSTGNIVVMVNKYYGLRTYDIARAIKTEECLMRGIELPRWDQMRRQLQHSVWYYHAPGGNLFNGAKTSPDTPPTVIPLPRIVQLVKMAVSSEAFESSRSECCLQGICSSTPRQPCSWYKYGLSRCQTIRFEARRDAEAELNK